MESLGLERRRRDLFFNALDYKLLLPLFLMSIQGLYVLNDVLAQQFSRAYPRNILVQVVAVILGFLALALVTLLEPMLLKPMSWALAVVALGLQCLLPVLGSAEIAAQTGSNAWLILPGIGSFQPSELSKLAIALQLGFLLGKLDQGQMSKLRALGFGALIVLPHLALILGYQHDAGTAMVVLAMVAAVIFIWGLRWRWIVAVFSLGLISIPILWNYVLKPYQQKRILAFLFPNFDQAATYNVDQAKLAIASGGLWGQSGADRIHVPVQESDFIFSAVGAYMGLLGTALLIILAFVFLFRCLYITAQESDPAQRYIMIALTTLFAVHYIENIGMNIGLLPVTGIPLPFISQGGSAMLVNYLAVGIMMNISLSQRMSRQL